MDISPKVVVRKAAIPRTDCFMVGPGQNLFVDEIIYASVDGREGDLIPIVKSLFIRMAQTVYILQPLARRLSK